VVKGPARPGPPATSSPARTHPTHTTSATTTVLTLHLHIYPRFLRTPTARLLPTTEAPSNLRTAIHSTRQIRIPIEKGPRPPLKRPTRAFHADASDHTIAPGHQRPRDRASQDRLGCHCDVCYSRRRTLVALLHRRPDIDCCGGKAISTQYQHIRELRSKAFWAAGRLQHLSAGLR
jgi:hypothetical protein